MYFLDRAEDFGAGKSNVVFVPSIINTESNLLIPSSTKSTGVSLQIETVVDNKSKFTKRDVLRAELVCRLQHIAAHPSDNTILHMATKKPIKDSPIVPCDIRLAKAILGHSVYGINGKRTFRSKDPVQIQEQILLPQSVKDHYMNLTIAADVLYANQIPILATISRGVHYGMFAPLPNMKVKTLETAILAVIQSYALCGFVVQHLLVDIQFQCLQHAFKDHQVTVNGVSSKEHVPEIERFIQVIKE